MFFELDIEWSLNEPYHQYYYIHATACTAWRVSGWGLRTFINKVARPAGKVVAPPGQDTGRPPADSLDAHQANSLDAHQAAGMYLPNALHLTIFGLEGNHHKRQGPPRPRLPGRLVTHARVEDHTREGMYAPAPTTEWPRQQTQEPRSHHGPTGSAWRFPQETCYMAV